MKRAPWIVFAFLVSVSSGIAQAQDSDGDGVPDVDDLCFGPDGIDSDGDGYPAGCDCDETDITVNAGASDVCDGVDNDCDGRLDVHSPFYWVGPQLLPALARGEVLNPGARSLVGDGAALSVGPSPGTLDNDVYLRIPLELQDVAGPRVLDVLVQREGALGDHDFELGITDGVRVVAAGLFNSGTDGQRYTPSVHRLDDGGAALLRASPVVSGRSMENITGIFGIRFTLGERPTVRFLNQLGRVETLPADVPGYESLDPSVPWSLVLFGNQPHESYKIYVLGVSQPIPARGGEVDADGDGFPASCDCDDGRAETHPGARDVCNGVDDECAGDGDRATVLSGTGADIWSLLRQGRAAIAWATPSFVGERLTLSLLPANQMYLNIPLELERTPVIDQTDDLTVEVEVALDSPQMESLQGVIVGLMGDTSYAGVRVAPDALEAITAFRTGTDQPFVWSAAPLGTHSLSAPYRIRFRAAVNGGTHATLIGADGARTTERRLPSPVSPHEALALALVTFEAAAAVDIDSLVVTQDALDTDQDSVCDRLDRCSGDDLEDMDGDGVGAACDCDDANPTLAPFSAETCDGVDQDCDDRPDVTRLVHIRDHDDFRQMIVSGRAEQSFPGNLLRVGDATRFFRQRWVSYRQPISLLEGVPLTLVVDSPIGAPPAIHFSDGSRTRGVELEPVFETLPDGRQVLVGSIQRFLGASDFGTQLSAGLVASEASLPALPSTARTYRVLVADGEMVMTPLDPPGAPVRQPWDLSSGPVELVLSGVPWRAELGSLELYQGLEDADLDLVCDALDVCAGFPDRVDGDADSIPDYCDPCLGRNGVDLDGDGVPSGCDCDDTRPEVRPGARDICNRVDDDCNGTIDGYTALSVRGAEMMYHLGSGAAVGGTRPLAALEGGSATRIGPSPASFDHEVFFREPLELLPRVGAAQRLRLTIDRAPRVGDHDLHVLVTDGRRSFGVGVFDLPTGECLFAPIHGSDEGHRIDVQTGSGESLPDGGPLTFDFVLGDGDPAVTVTTADGRMARISSPAALVEAMDLGGLSLVLAADQPEETYVIRRLEVSQQLPDSDGDTVCDAADYCDGEDDTGADADGDLVVDVCDICPGGDDRIDTDADGIPNACDICDAEDDLVDTDGDHLPDACDPCPDDPANDSDGDMVCDMVDRCLPGDDGLDTDGDGIPDDCDLCPTDDMDDSDEDGTCDVADVCLGDDRRGDLDGDGYCGDRDCDDARPNVYPGAEEICDGRDTNCSGAIPWNELDLDGDLVIECRREAASGGCSTGGSPARGALPFLLGLAAGLGLLRRRSRGRRRS